MFTSSTFIGILYGQMVRHVLHDHGELPLVLLHTGHLLGVKVWSSSAGAEDNLKWAIFLFYHIYLEFWQKGPVIAFNEKFNFIQILWSVVDSDFPLMHSLRRANWFISKRLANIPLYSTTQVRVRSFVQWPHNISSMICSADEALLFIFLLPESTLFLFLRLRPLRAFLFYYLNRMT